MNSYCSAIRAASLGKINIYTCAYFFIYRICHSLTIFCALFYAISNEHKGGLMCSGNIGPALSPLIDGLRLIISVVKHAYFNQIFPLLPKVAWSKDNLRRCFFPSIA